jgi:hypothetical protein
LPEALSFRTVPVTFTQLALGQTQISYWAFRYPMSKPQGVTRRAMVVALQFSNSQCWMATIDSPRLIATLFDYDRQEVRRTLHEHGKVWDGCKTRRNCHQQ